MTLIAVCGATASGKTTLAKQLVSRFDLSRVVTTTTRPPRPGECQQDYHFVSQREFADQARRGEFLEWVAFCGHLYGITKSAVELAVGSSKAAVVVCTPHALAKLSRWTRAQGYGFRSVFLASDRQMLKQRLLDREGFTFSDHRRLASTDLQKCWLSMHQYDLVIDPSCLATNISDVGALIAV